MNRFSTFEDIHKAAVEGDVALVSQKLKQGTSPNIKAVDNGWTPLHYAANYNQTRVAAILLKAGADPDAPSDSGWTPLAHNPRFAGHGPDTVEGGGRSGHSKQGWQHSPCISMPSKTTRTLFKCC